MQKYAFTGQGHVVIVIPAYKEQLNTEEQYSVRALQKHLAKYDVAIVTPETLRSLPIPCHQEKYRDSYFENTATYSKLLLSREFYERFAQYEYMLVYQLDALVFSDQLSYWCSQKYDYIGAPVNLRKNNSASPAFVGNGGFSLRNIASCLTVLTQGNLSRTQAQTFRSLLTNTPVDVASFGGLSRVRKALSIARQMRTGVDGYIQQYTMNEDLFWSLRATAFAPNFALPSLEVAARFAVETNPRMWLALSGNELPFGCHAWAKWDRSVWEAYLP